MATQPGNAQDGGGYPAASAAGHGKEVGHYAHLRVGNLGDEREVAVATVTREELGASVEQQNVACLRTMTPGLKLGRRDARSPESPP